MPNIQVTYTYVPNTKILSAAVNQNFNDVVNILKAHHHDPNIYANAVPVTNSGIAPNAQILDTQLKSQITRSGLINNSALPTITTGFGGTGINAITPGAMLAGNASNVWAAIYGSAGQVPIVQGNGTIAFGTPAIGKFGGTGTDGALSISSGTTTIDCANAAIVVKNYTSISITGTGKLAFSNPNTNGTAIILKSQGAVTLTSSTNPLIDTRGMGGALGAAGGSSGSASVAGTGGGGGAGASTAGAQGGSATAGGTTGTAASTGNGFLTLGAGGGGQSGTGGVGGTIPLVINYNFIPYYKMIFLLPGGGGGGGGGGEGAAGGAGAAGGGSLYIEVGGALNFTGTINASGNTGSNGSTNGGVIGGGGGGGGGSGSVVIIYASLTANSGTITVAGGSGGSGGAGGGFAGGNGGAGGNGFSIVASNTEFV